MRKVLKNSSRRKRPEVLLNRTFLVGDFCGRVQSMYKTAIMNPSKFICRKALLLPVNCRKYQISYVSQP